MGRRRKNRGRDISGVVVVDKPAGLSSNDAVQKAKFLFRAAKVGHTGSLDPLARGVLPLCFGEATKFSQFLLSSDKKYWARIKLGIRTDSGDADGKVVETRPVPEISTDTLERELDRFRGEIDQVPSMFSAIKHQGQPLYKLARQGIEVRVYGSNWHRSRHRHPNLKVSGREVLLLIVRLDSIACEAVLPRPIRELSEIR